MRTRTTAHKREPRQGGARARRLAAAGRDDEIRQALLNKALVRRVATLIVAAVVLYGVAPAILEVLGAYRRLRDVHPGWWIVVFMAWVASTWCTCALQRLALNRADWFPVVSSQLAGAAISKVVPGGSAAAAALQARMLAQAGLAPAAIGTGLTAGALLLLCALAGLPLLAVPALLLGRHIPDGLLAAAAIELGVFVALFVMRTLLLVNDRVLKVLVRTLQASACRLRRRRSASEELSERTCSMSASACAILCGGGGRRRRHSHRTVDLRLPVPLRGPAGGRRAAAPIRGAAGLQRRSAARPGSAHARRAGRGRGGAQRDAGAGGRRCGAGGAGHARLPIGVLLASSSDRSGGLALASPALPAMRLIVIGAGGVGTSAGESLHEQHDCGHRPGCESPQIVSDAFERSSRARRRGWTRGAARRRGQAG